MKIAVRAYFFLALILVTGCIPARLAVYSRPGGAEVYVDDILIARTVNEATPVRIETTVGSHHVRIMRDGYLPWERIVEVKRGQETPLLANLVLTPPAPVHIPLGVLEIRTDPGGVEITMNGQPIGFSKAESSGPVRVENLAPGEYLLRFTRPGYEPVEARYEVFAAQTTRAAVRIQPLTPYFVYASNDDLLRRAAIKAVQGIPFIPGMSTNRTVALVSLDGEREGLDDIKPLVEDVLIAELARNGRPVAERDDHLLVRLAHEAARGESMILEVMTRHGGKSQPFLYDARLQSAANALALLTTDDAGNSRRIVVEDRRTPPDAAIPSADHILGYKIVEKTLRVDPVDAGGRGEPMLRREAILRIYVRLIDSRTGIVKWAERFDASLADHVPVRVYRWLENPPSRLYAYSMPPEATKDTTPPEPEQFTPTDVKRLDDRDAVFWYYRHLGDAYLRSDRIEEAVYHLKEAAALRPDDYETRMLLGEALMKSGDIDGAGREYVQALRTL